MTDGLHAAYCRTHDGELLDAGGPLEEELRAFAERVPRFFGRDVVATSTLLGQAEAGSMKLEFEQVVLVDDDRYYIAQLLAESPETTLVAIASRKESLASVLAKVRGRKRVHTS